MKISNTEPEYLALADAQQVKEEDERKRRWLFLLLLLLLLLCCCVGFLFIRYLTQPQPITEIVPVNVNYPPSYKFSINNVDDPVSVAVSPDGQRLYVAESGGERLVKVFNRDGVQVSSFAPTGTNKSTRAPKFMAVDASGRVFLVDGYNNAIHIFDADGNYLDAIIAPDLTLTKVLAQNLGGSIPAGATYYMTTDSSGRTLTYSIPGKTPGSVKIPASTYQLGWQPLGIRFDINGNLMYTDLTAGIHGVRIIPADALSGSLAAFAPQIKQFGVQGKEAGQFDFPNSVVVDSRGNFYISDGNNSRISTWTSDMQYRKFFAFGSTEQALNLPRGLWIDSRDRLHVADSVGATIRVYDVSGDEPAFLYSFGMYGVSEGRFNYPNDICLDGTGRLYIADRSNNRVQVWSY